MTALIPPDRSTADLSTPDLSPADLSTPDLSTDVQAAFVERLAQWGNVRAAAAQVGVSRAHLYRMRRASAAFRQLWDAALVLARPQVEEVLADRALNGVAETVFYHGEEVATRTRYDARLLLAHLARLDRLVDAQGVYAAVNDFDAKLEQLRNPVPLIDWDEEEDYDADEWAADEAGEDDFSEGWAASEGPAGKGATDRARRAMGAGFCLLDSVFCVSNTCGTGEGGPG